MTGAEIVAVARTFLGTRYLHQGRSRAGVDCIGLPVCVRAELGLPALDASGYARSSASSEMLDYCKANMIEIQRADLTLGDVLVQMDGTARHMAIVADCAYGGFSIIHAWLPSRKVVECRLDDYFMQTVRGCFRFPEVVA